MRRKEKLDYAKIAALELELYGEVFTSHAQSEPTGCWPWAERPREAGVPRCLNCGDKSMWDHGAWRCRSGCTVVRVDER